MTVQREVEWQLTAPDLIAVRRWLAQHESRDGLRIEPQAPITLHDVYFDTDDWRMHRAGFALRVRSSSQGTAATLKSLSSSQEGVQNRLEVTEALPAELSANPSATSGPVGERVRAVTGDRALHALFEARTERERYDVSDGEAQIGEIALDDTVIARVGGEPQAGVRRVEVEAKNPEVSSLQALVHNLRTDCTLDLATESKYRVGLAAAGLDPPAGPDSRAIGIDPQTRIDTVAFRELRLRLAAWYAHEPGARLGEDAGELHDLRVAGRRIDTTLRLFEQYVPRTLTRTRYRLKKLLRVLGASRDRDVQFEELDRLTPTLTAAQAAALVPVRARLIAQRTRVRRHMLKALDAPSTQRWFKGLTAFVLSQHPAQEQGDVALAANVAPILVRKRYRSFRKLADQLDDHSSMDSYHRARTQLKKLRYTVETFASLYGEEADSFLAAVRRLQGCLGEQQDAHVAATRLFALAQRKTADLPHSAAFVMGQVAERHNASALKKRAQFSKAYRRVCGRRWKRLRRVMRAARVAEEGAD